MATNSNVSGSGAANRGAMGISAGEGTEAVPLPVAGAPLRVWPTAPASLTWRHWALFLAGGAQLVTISYLESTSPLPVSWSSLLLSVAPVLVIAGAVFLPARAALVAAVAGLAVLIAGMAGQATHAGLVFLPAFVVLAVGAVLLWREQAAPASSAAPA